MLLSLYTPTLPPPPPQKTTPSHNRLSFSRQKAANHRPPSHHVTLPLHPQVRRSTTTPTRTCLPSPKCSTVPRRRRISSRSSRRRNPMKAGNICSNIRVRARKIVRRLWTRFMRCRGSPIRTWMRCVFGYVRVIIIIKWNHLVNIYRCHRTLIYGILILRSIYLKRGKIHILSPML